MVATGSIAGNVLKYLAIDDDFKEAGKTFNLIVSRLLTYASNNGIFHLFVFTKPIYVDSFRHVGFHLLAKSAVGAILETGTPQLQDYLRTIPKPARSQAKVAAIVMNANPFTRGHYGLVERASQDNDLVYVFVVSADKSLFSFDERFDLVKEGTKQLKNVIVLPGKDYMVSPATFPAYFLKKGQDTAQYQAELDALLFKQQIVKSLGITSRYVGSEPFSKTTNIYNQQLHAILSPEVDVIEVPRLKTSRGQVITATQVRHMIATGDLQMLSTFVPETTEQFIVSHLGKLKQRLTKGSTQNGN